MNVNICVAGVSMEAIWSHGAINKMFYQSLGHHRCGVSTCMYLKRDYFMYYFDVLKKKI
jgi:hypothetical protein